MNRRRFLSGAAQLGCALSLPMLPGIAAATAKVTAPPEATAAWARRIRTILDRGGLPIIDMEATYVDGATNVARMIDYMDRFDIAQIAYAPANAPDSSPSLSLYHQHPEYFIPTTNSGEFARWWRDPAAFLTGVRADLASGNYVLMGEYEFRHYPSPEQLRQPNINRDISIDIAGPAGQALFALSEETGVAFQIHYEPEDRLLDPLEQMLARYPNAKVIWCHLGMIRYPDRARRYNPDYVNTLLERFPGLHFDLAVPPPGSVYTPSGAHDSTLYSDGKLAPDWKAVIEAHQDRFVAASDYRPPVETDYPAQMQRQRNLILAALSPAAQHQVAYGNAWRLITGQAWGS